MEAEGFEAICAGGYAAIGSMLAQADMGQSNVRDYADHYARICDAVEIPVFVDADTGFGGVNNVRQMVRAFEAAGVAGMFFSDQVFPNRCGYLPGKQVVPVEQMLAKIKAALDARRDLDFFIAARTDAAGAAATFPSIALFAAAHAVRNVVGLLKRENSLTPTFEQLLPLDDYYALVGLKEQLAREEAYDKAAAALARKRAAE
jgi:2-methylisocitrate lyase-like PEP mutase family enzyme